MEQPGRSASGSRDGNGTAHVGELGWDPSFGLLGQGLGLSTIFNPDPETISHVPGRSAFSAPRNHVATQRLNGPRIAARNHSAGDAAATEMWAAHTIPQQIPLTFRNAEYIRMPSSQGTWMGPTYSTAVSVPVGAVDWALTSAAVGPIAAPYGAITDSTRDSAQGQLTFPFGQTLDARFDLHFGPDVPLTAWSDGGLDPLIDPGVSAPIKVLTEDPSPPNSVLHATGHSSTSPSAPLFHDFSSERQVPASQQRKSKPKPPPPPPSLEIIQFKPDAGSDEDRSKKRRARDSEGSAGLTPRTLKKVTYKDENGEMRGTMMTLGNPEHYRSRFTPQKRLETKLARREGVCSRCQGSKRKCDLALKQSLYVPCTRCSTSRLYKNVSPMPCFKSILKDAMFFRDGPAANEPFFTERFKRLTVEDISKPDVPVRNLQLTQHVGHKLMIYASEFVPLPKDKVSLTWKDAKGNQREMRMPPFCLTNMQKITAQVLQYIAVAKQSYLESYVLASNNELVATTVKMAMQYAKAKAGSLVSLALDLWAVSRIIEIEWEMCGPDTLGVSRVTDRTNPRFRKIPIPPMMDTQLDRIVITEVLHPLRKKLLDQFEAKISPLRPEDWFDIYLTAFIVLDHIERLAQHSAYHAKLHSMPGRFSNVPFLTNVFHAAKVVLSRFHFVCNGSAPLCVDWDSSSVRSMAKLEVDQITFMKKTQALIKARENDIANLRTSHKYGESLYWSSQLFTKEWDDSPARVIEVA